jgi:hypothetical protein
MHVLQWIATKAENPEEAYRNVEQHLESQMSGNDSQATWYDWFVVGGGRWNVAENEDWRTAYDGGKTNMIVGSDNVEEFEAALARAMNNRMEEFKSYRKQWDESNINLNATLDTYEGVMVYNFDLYPLKKMIDMYQGEWDYNAYFWDMDNWSTNPEHMNKDRLNVGGVWYIVPVDFHF